MATSQSSTAITTQGKEEPASAQTAEGSSSLPRSAAKVDDAAASEGDDNPTHSETPNGRAIASADHSVSAEPGQVPSTQPAHSSPNGTSQAAPLNVSLTSPPSGKEKADDSDGQKETDKDKASFDTTLTGTHTNPRTQSSPRKQTKTVSEGAHTASTSGEEKPSRPKSLKKKAKVKASLFSRLFHVFVPCIGPSTRAHDIEPQAPKPKSSAPPVPVPAAPVALKEKQPSKEAEELPPKPEPESPAPPAAVEEQPSKTEETSVVPPPLQPIEIPSQPSDSEVVVPPTPTRSLLPREETEGVTSGAVQPPGSTGEEGLHEHHEHHHTHTQDSENESDGSTSFTDDDDLDDGTPMDEIEDEEERLIMSGGAGIPIGPDGMPRPLLPPLSPKHAGRKCLVLDLDETLVHSSFKSIQQADYVVPVEIEYHWHNVYVIKRPGVDSFLKKMGEIYEVVVFTASLSKYADPVLDKLDVNRVVSHRLFRESCYNHRGNYVKDLSQLGRPISDTIIIDNSPASYIFHPNNAVPVSSWFTDPHDQELSDLCPFLTDLATVDDIRGVLDGGL